MMNKKLGKVLMFTVMSFGALPTGAMASAGSPEQTSEVREDDRSEVGKYLDAVKEGLWRSLRGAHWMVAGSWLKRALLRGVVWGADATLPAYTTQDVLDTWQSETLVKRLALTLLDSAGHQGFGAGVWYPTALGLAWWDYMGRMNWDMSYAHLGAGKSLAEGAADLATSTGTPKIPTDRYRMVSYLTRFFGDHVAKSVAKLAMVPIESRLFGQQEA